MTLPLLLITGGTGYVGSHVIKQAVETGYAVRALSRPAKATALREMYGSKIEVVEIEDIATANFEEALKGVWAVLHLAAPLPGRESLDQMIQTAVSATSRLLRQAAEAGVARLVLTSSIATLYDWDDLTVEWNGRVYSEKDWNSTKMGKGNQYGLYHYQIVKTLTEMEVWTFADEHQEIDITTINPSYVYGPFVPGFPVKSITDMATVAYIYEHILGGIKDTALPPPFASVVVDVRDVARAHILALTAPTEASLAGAEVSGKVRSTNNRKRFILSGPDWWLGDAIKYLETARPELEHRLANVGALPVPLDLRLDRSLAEEVLGMRSEGYIDWRKTVEDTIDSILEVERKWGPW